MEIAGSSRPCSGSEHLFSHALDEHYDINIPHGIKVALGTIASCIFQNRSYNVLLDFLKRYHVKIHPSSLGMTEDIFVGAWLKAKATRPERFTVLDTIDLDEFFLRKVYQEIVEVLE